VRFSVLVHIVFARKRLGAFRTLDELFAAVDFGVAGCVAGCGEVAFATELGRKRAWMRVL